MPASLHRPWLFLDDAIASDRGAHRIPDGIRRCINLGPQQLLKGRGYFKREEVSGPSVATPVPHRSLRPSPS